MYQIDGPTVAPSLPAPGALGAVGFFTDGDLLGGTAPTIVPAAFLNALMLELLGVVTAAGLAPSKTQNNQVLLAIEQLIAARSGNYSPDTGVANAYVIAFSPAISAYTNGLSVKFRAAHANTAASTLSAGAGTAPLLREDGTALQPGDIPPNSVVSATYDLGAGGFLINSLVLSQFGTAAKENIGNGLYDDGAGNLAINPAFNFFMGQL